MDNCPYSGQPRPPNKASPTCDLIELTKLYNPLFLNLLNLSNMVLKHTIFNMKTTWWRPMITALGLLFLVGYSSQITAQECDIIVSSKDGEVLAPDGTTVDLIYIDLDLDNDLNDGMAELVRTLFAGTPTSPGRITSSYYEAAPGGDPSPCNLVFIYDVNGNLIDFDIDADGDIDDTDNADGDNDPTTNGVVNSNPTLIFDCDDRDDGPTPRRGTRFFVKIDDDTDPNFDDPADADNDPISSYAAIEIRSIEDNHGPVIIPPPNRTIFCEYTRDPYEFYDTDEFDGDMNGNDDNFLGIVHNPFFDLPRLNDPQPGADPADPTNMRYDGRVDDNCASYAQLEPTISYRDEVVHPFVVGRREIRRIWSATDQSGNVGTAVQIVTIIDDENPEFLALGTNTTTTADDVDVTPDPADPTVDDTYVYESYFSATGRLLACEEDVPPFTPLVEDNCDVWIDIFSEVTNDRPTNSTRTTNCRYYDYTSTRTFRAVDDFGRTSTATRTYLHRDRIPPVFTSVHNSLGTPTFSQTTATNLTATTLAENSTCGFTGATYLKRKDLYTASGRVVLSPSGPNGQYGPCTAVATFNPVATDDCAPDNTLRYFYEAYEISPQNTQGSFFKGGEFVNNNFTVKELRSGTTYRIRIKVKDVVGNISCIDTEVEVRPTLPIISCGSILQVPFDPSNSQTFVTAQQILGFVPDQPCNYDELTFEIRDIADGAVVLPSGRSTGSGNGSALTSAAGNASVTFDCSDLGSDRQVEVKVVNNNGGEVICTRIVRLISSGNSSISSSAVGNGSSAVATADGSITVTTSGDPGPFTYTYTGPTSGTQTGNSPYTITGLLTGTYSVNVSSNNGCSNTTVSNIYVPVDDPIELYSTCPQAVTGGVIDIPIKVRDFNKMNSTEFTVTLTGGLSIISTTTPSLPASTTVNEISSTVLTFSWFLQDMNNNPPVTLADGADILIIRAQAPNTAGNYTVVIDGSVTNVSATQNQGGGAAASTSVSVNYTAPLCTGTVADSPASVNGNINFFSSTGSGVNGVTITLNSNGNATTDMTNATGGYSVQAMPNSNVTLTPTRPHTSQTQLLDGVNGGDLVQIQRYLLSLTNTLAGNPYKIIAADANGNNTVDGGDLVLIQRAILSLENSFNVPSWRFVRSTQTFSNPNDPFAATLQESYVNASLNTAVTANFIGIKTGDVDCSANYPYKLTTTTGTEKAANADLEYRGVLPIQVKERKLKVGETYEVKFTAQDFRDMLTYQTTIEFDTDALEFINLTTGNELDNLSEANFGLNKAAEGMITTLWYNATEQSLVDGTEVFTLKFRALEETALSHVLRFTSNGIAQMAMGADFETLNVDLNFENAIKPADKFNLGQNTPNPFGDDTSIVFELTEGGQATIAIMDITGKVVKTYQDNFTQGVNEVKVNRADLAGAGIYFYQLTTNTAQSAVRKMIVVD